MRIAAFISLALLAACSSEKPADDTVVTLDGSGGNAPAAAAAPSAPAAVQNGIQAVDAEGPKLEPLLSSAISAAGLEIGSCRFSPAQGALPVLVASRIGDKSIISIAGKPIDVTPSGAVAMTGGSFSAQGVTLMVSAGGAAAAGSTATMQVTDSDGPAFVYQNGFWLCN